MSKHQDALLRQWLMLRHVPRYPRKVTVRDLHRVLVDEGFDITERSVQRDLNELSGAFAIVCDDREKPYGWSWQKDVMLTDTRTGVQVAASQGSASKMDFGLGVLGVGSSGGAAIGAYGNTPEGKVIASAFMDSYNQMVRAVRTYAPQRVAGGLGTGGHLHVAGDGNDNTSVTDAQRALSDLGLYTGKIDGIDGPGTRAAISKFQRIRGLPASGELDAETAQALAQ